MKRILIVLAVILLMVSTNSFAQRATVLSGIDTNLPSSSKLTAAQLRTALKAISNSVYDELDGTVKIDSLQDPTPIIYSTVGTAQINAQTASYTATISDLGKEITINSASATTFTIPLYSSVAFPVGAIINVTRLGAGDVTIAITATGVLQSESSWVKIGAQYTSVSILKIATDTWLIRGRLKA